MKVLNLLLILYLFSTFYVFLFFIPDMKNRLSIEGMEIRNCDIGCRDIWYENNSLSIIDQDGNISLLALILIAFISPIILIIYIIFFISLMLVVFINDILMVRFTV